MARGDDALDRDALDRDALDRDALDRDALDRDALDRFGSALAAARRIVLFTGAGISTDSGIPDFRGPGGMWSKYRPIEFQDFIASEDMRREYWRRKFAVDPVIQQAEPNDGHAAIAHMVDGGRVSSVITQNVDGLHQKSGVPAERIIELHGNTTYAACLDCGERYELAPIKAAFEESGSLPVCRACDGIVKAATISFGQSMPRDEILRAEAESLNCDLFVVIGSSLVVYPAAALPEKARWNGATLVILNGEPTPLDALANIVLHRDIGTALAGVMGAVTPRLVQ
jgi:NAD-dependent deacetylase